MKRFSYRALRVLSLTVRLASERLRFRDTETQRTVGVFLNRRWVRLVSFVRVTLSALALSSGVFAHAQIVASSTAGSRVVDTDYTRAELLIHAPDGVEADKGFWLGLRLKHQPGWKSYWLNPGEAGLPTRFEWTLPRGVSAESIHWPRPSKFLLGQLVNYGYAGTVLLPVPMRVTSEFSRDRLNSLGLEVELKATWLVCREVCIPEEGRFQLQITSGTKYVSYAGAFATSLAAQPRELVSASSRIDVEGDALAIRVTGLPLSLVGLELDFFPETSGIINASAPWSQRWDGVDWTARIALATQRVVTPEELAIVLTTASGGWRTNARVFAGASAATIPATANAPSVGGESTAATRRPTWRPAVWFALVSALVGGLILNLMPCVLPVLAIKVLGFARTGDENAARRVDGLAYTLGVVMSFVALGALMVALRAAGQAVGWGFQLQNPAIVAALAVLFTLIGLNFVGVVTFGQLLPSSWMAFRARHRVINAFLTGVLAVAVASPCTAPFMGAALGVATTLPTPQALAIFAALGLGMAIPVLVASWAPAVGRVLPRPGRWMDTLRRFLAFPMFATVVWLLWVLGMQTGVDALIATLALLVAISLLAWGACLRSATRVAVVVLAAFAVVWMSVWMIHEVREASATPSSRAQTKGWETWSPDKVDTLLGEGRPVFVDFTAAWCITCQYNKRNALSDPSVLAAFQAKNLALLRADWTRRDAKITATLATFGRTGVPLYVLYVPGKSPQVLSEILTTTELTSAMSAIRLP